MSSDKSTSHYSRTVLIGRTPPEWYDGGPRTCAVELDFRMDEGKNTTAPYLDFHLNPAPELRSLSICGSIWRPDRRDIAAGGQCVDEIREMFPDDEKVQRVCQLWDQWHLNDLTPGTAAQTVAIEQWKAAELLKDPEWRYDYGAAVDHLKGLGLYENGAWTPSHLVKEDHEKMFSRPYTYGAAWLVRQIPDEVWQEVRELAESWPQSDRGKAYE